MYLDEIPELMLARHVKQRGKGRPIRESGRAAAVVWMSDGSVVPPEWIVRFDIAEREDPARRLADAFSLTGAHALWFYGGDTVAWRGATQLGLQLSVHGGVAVRRHDATRARDAIVLRPPSAMDGLNLGEAMREYAPGFHRPSVLCAEHKGELIGLVLSESLDATWSEIRAFVFPAHRGRGFGSMLLAKHADQIEGAGRLVCAAFEALESKSRGALESSGFRIADYYFAAHRAKVAEVAAPAAAVTYRPKPIRA